MAFPHPCPLCGAAAQFEPVGFPSPRRHYLCPNCTEFVIKESHEAVVAGYTLPFRQQFSALAMQSHGDYICVFSVTTSNGRTDLHCEPALRSQALS